MLIARQAMELIGGGMSLQEAASHLGITHNTVADGSKRRKHSSPRTKKQNPADHLRGTIQAGAKRPLHDVSGTICIRGITQINERTLMRKILFAY